MPQTMSKKQSSKKTEKMHEDLDFDQMKDMLEPAGFPEYRATGAESYWHLHRDAKSRKKLLQILADELGVSIGDGQGDPNVIWEGFLEMSWNDLPYKLRRYIGFEWTENPKYRLLEEPNSVSLYVENSDENIKDIKEKSRRLANELLEEYGPSAFAKSDGYIVNTNKFKKVVK